MKKAFFKLTINIDYLTDLSMANIGLGGRFPYG